MLRKLIRRRDHRPQRTKEDEGQVHKEWLTKGFVIRMVLIIAVGGPVMATLISPFFDQAVRNTIDDWMSEPDLFESISIGPDEFAQLPQYWKQTLAEIALRPKEEAADAQAIIEGLTLEDMELIGLLAPYLTGLGILRDKDRLSEHPMPELSYSDFSHLEDLGILEDVNNGMRYKLNEDWSPDTTAELVGTTILLRFRTTSASERFDLEVTAFTRGGKQIFDSLRLPSNIAYFEWFAKTLEKKGFDVELFVARFNRSGVSETLEIQGGIERHSIPEWPP